MVLVSKISICYTVCGKISSIIDSYHAKDIEVNSKAHLAMTTLGKEKSWYGHFLRHDGHAPSHHFQGLWEPQQVTEGGY